MSDFILSEQMKDINNLRDFLYKSEQKVKWLEAENKRLRELVNRLKRIIDNEYIDEYKSFYELKDVIDDYFAGKDEAVKHGVNCEKVSHKGRGYLHLSDDDMPYTVDNCWYCGRCHVAIEKDKADGVPNMPETD